MARLANTLAMQAINFYSMAYAPLMEIESYMTTMRATYFELQMDAQYMPQMQGQLGMQLLDVGNALRQMGAYVMAEAAEWGYDNWRNAHHGWWNNHWGWNTPAYPGNGAYYPNPGVYYPWQ